MLVDFGWLQMNWNEIVLFPFNPSHLVLFQANDSIHLSCRLNSKWMESSKRKAMVEMTRFHFNYYNSGRSDVMLNAILLMPEEGESMVGMSDIVIKSWTGIVRRFIFRVQSPLKLWQIHNSVSMQTMADNHRNCIVSIFVIQKCLKLSWHRTPLCVAVFSVSHTSSFSFLCFSFAQPHKKCKIFYTNLRKTMQRKWINL